MVKETTWPKTYLLEIYSAAVANGFIWVQPITEANALSLRQSLYRARRRADTTAAGWILPEYHLVTCGKWEPGPAGSGRLPVTYNLSPDGALPQLTPATEEERLAFTQHTPPPAYRPLPAPIDVEQAALGPTVPPTDLQLPADFDISNFVRNMKRNVEGDS